MFTSRVDAGKKLGKELKRQNIRADLVLGIARGGVVVACEISKVLGLPLDVLVVRKLAAPSNPELAYGALTFDDVTYLDEDLIRSLEVDGAEMATEIIKKHHELIDRNLQLRKSNLPPEVKGKRVILVDDGVATGATALAAIQWLDKQQVKQVTLALPVVAETQAKQLCKLAGTCVILEKPNTLNSVGSFYKEFAQVEEEEVKQLLERYHK